jgi:hypothetical protein
MVNKIITLLLLTILLNGCKPSGEDIAGRYYARHNKGIEYIDVKQDGTYLHYFKNDSIGQKQEGKWEYEREGLHLRFIMYDWIEYIEPFEKKFIANGNKSIANVLCDGEIIQLWDLDEYNFHRKTK